MGISAKGGRGDEIRSFLRFSPSPPPKEEGRAGARALEIARKIMMEGWRRQAASSASSE